MLVALCRPLPTVYSLLPTTARWLGLLSKGGLSVWGLVLVPLCRSLPNVYSLLPSTARWLGPLSKGRLSV